MPMTKVNPLISLCPSENQRNRFSSEDSGEVSEASSSNPMLAHCPSIGSTDGTAEELRRKVHRIQNRLAHGLTAFLSSSAGGPHLIRRLLAADIKRLYRVPIMTGDTNNTILTSDPVSNVIQFTAETGAVPKEFAPRVNKIKGGYRVTRYLTIDSKSAEPEPAESLGKLSDFLPVDGAPIECLKKSAEYASGSTTSNLPFSAHFSSSSTPDPCSQDASNDFVSICLSSFNLASRLLRQVNVALAFARFETSSLNTTETAKIDSNSSEDRLGASQSSPKENECNSELLKEPVSHGLFCDLCGQHLA
ncbi:unnamed protein product, partial [Protopolystoma xenopodis]